MKFIGQYIQDLIARFRSDVYLENISSGTIASGGSLGLDSNNKIVKASASAAPDADATTKGIVELATTAETTTGTDATRAVTPDGLKDGYQGSTNIVTLGSITTGAWRGDAIDQAYLVGQSGTNTGDQTSVTGNAGTATKLATQRDLQVDLAESGADGFDGSGDALAIGVGSTVLGVTNGGTGLTSISTLLNSNTTKSDVGLGNVENKSSATIRGEIVAGDIPTLNQNTTGSAATLTTERNLQVNLASTSSDGFDGGGNATDIGVSGTLAVGNGGTGLTSISTLLNSNVTSVSGNAGTATALATSRNLQVDLTSTSAQGFTGAANATSIGVNGVLPIANGGTGSSSQKVIQVFPMNFVDDLGTDKHFMPFVTNTEQVQNYQEEACMVMPADGRVVSVTVHYAQMHGSDGNITVGIETSPCGQSYTNTWDIEETAVLPATVADDHHVFHFAFDDAKHFESTDKMAISIQQSADMQNASRFFWVTAVVEYDWSTFLAGSNPGQEYTTTP